MSTTVHTGAEAKKTYAVEAGGAATESMGGIAVIVLSILALSGVLPRVLGSIAGIVFGAAFIIEGAAIAARFRSIMTEAVGDRANQIELSSGVTVEVVAGLACLVLGILALVGVAPAVLLPALVIIGGAGLILAAGAVHRMHSLRAAQMGDPIVQAVTGATVTSAAAGQVLAGIGVTVLGIIALMSINYGLVLSLVGLLVMGSAITLSGTALSTKMLSLFRRG
jgi:hypothetical protein